jgi:uncharacterized membrane protein
MVRKSETVDLDLTIDQAMQFVISCGVVVPTQQLSSSRAIPQIPKRDNAGSQPGAAVESSVSGRG